MIITVCNCGTEYITEQFNMTVVLSK